MTNTLHHPLYADAQNYTDAADDPRLTKPQLICLDGLPIYILDEPVHWALVHVGDAEDVSIVHGLGCVEPVGDRLPLRARAVPMEVASGADLAVSDLAALDGGIVYVDDPSLEHGGYAIVEAYSDIIFLYLADVPAEACSYCFSEDENWARDENIHIFACKEASHD